MISYVNLGTNDLEQAKQFYSALLSKIGANVIHETERGVFFGKSLGEPMLVICTPYNQQPATFGNGTMVAINVGSNELVDEIYAKAIELGGACEGKPGYRLKEVFYAAYIRDLDGNKLAFTHRAY